MIIINKEVPDSFNLFLITDDHEGSLLRHSEGWDFMINQVRSKYDEIPPWNNYVVHHGDIVEGIMVDDKRYDGITTQAAVHEQMQQCKRNLKPIQKNIVAVLDGNHAWKLWKWFGPGKPGLTEVVCNSEDIKYGTASCVINYIDISGNLILKQFAAHAGGKSAPSSSAKDPKQRQNNIELGLKDRLKPKMGDCVLMSCGHWHKMIYCKPTIEFYLQSNSGKLKSGYTGQSVKVGHFIHPDHRHYLCCGSFLKTYGDDGMVGYAENAGYDPVELGYFVVKVRDRQIQDIYKITLG